MKKLFTLTSLLVSLACAIPSVRAFDLWQAYELAVKNDATYLAADAQRQATEQQKSQARAVLFPTIVATGSWKHTRESFIGSNRATNSNPLSGTLSLKQPLIQFDSFTAIKQVNANVDIATLTYEQAKQDLIVRVVQTYFNALLTKETARITAAKVKTAEQQVKMAEANFQVGNTTVIDTQEAQAAYHRARAEAITAQSNADNAWAVLEDMVGQPITESLAGIHESLKLKMPIPETQAKWVEKALRDNYNVQIAQKNQKIATLEVTKRAQKRLPTVDLVASQSWRSTQYNHDGDTQSKVGTYGVEVSMPIFDGGLISAQVREAEALRTKSFQMVRSTQTQVAQATRTAYNQATAGLATIEALEQANKSAAASARSNRLGYDLGMRINIDVLNAQQTQAQTQIDLAQAQYNTVMGNVQLKAAIAQLGSQDVAYINELLSHTPAKLDASKDSVSNVAQRTADTTQNPVSNTRTVVVKSKTSVKPSVKKQSL